MKDNREKALFDRYDMLVGKRKALLDKAINAERLLTDDEEAENKRLAAEIDKMDKLIRYARSLPENSGTAFKDINSDGERVLENRGFRHSGYCTSHRTLTDFIVALRNGDPSIHESRDMSMGGGAAVGGALVPEQFLGTVLKIDSEAALVRSRARIIRSEPPDIATTIPALNQAGGNGEFGGIEVQWIAEAAAKPQTEPELREIKLEPQEVAAHVVVADKLLRNAPECELFLSTTLTSALLAAEDQACLNGSGIGQPLGVLGHPGTIQVPRAGAGAIAFADFANMLAALHPDSLSRAVWCISQSAMAQVTTLVDGNNNLIFVGRDASKGLPPTILGVPVRFTGRLPVLGAPGDVLLADFSGYILKQGSGPYVKLSDGPRFVSNQSIIKAWYCVDGQPWLTGPLLLADGVTNVSFFVQLQ